MKIGLLKSVIVGAPVVATGMLALNAPAQAFVLSGVSGAGTVFIDASNIVYYDNAIDFQDQSNPIPAKNNPAWGTLGDFEVTNADGSLLPIFSPGVGAPNPDGKILDLVLPGVNVIPNKTYTVADGLPALGDGTIVSNFLRFDVNNSGSIDAGDLTYSFTAFTENPGSVGGQQTIQLAFEGYFQEIGSIINHGTKDEDIDLVGPRLSASAVLSAGVTINPNSLPSINCALSPNFPLDPATGAPSAPIANLDPTSSCARVFNGLAPDTSTGTTYTASNRGDSSADGPLSVKATVPEPSSAAGILALGGVLAFGMKKRKNLI